MTIAELFPGRERWVDAMSDRLAALAEEEGLPWRKGSRIYNTRLAQELAKWAEGEPGGDAIHEAIFTAYFAEGVNISDIDALVALAGQLGLSEARAHEVLTERTHREAVDRDWALSMASGVTGVPTFVAGGFGVVGAQPYETLVKLVEKAGGLLRL